MTIVRRTGCLEHKFIQLYKTSKYKIFHVVSSQQTGYTAIIIFPLVRDPPALQAVARFQVPHRLDRANWVHDLVAKSPTQMEDWGVVTFRGEVEFVSAQLLPDLTEDSAA